MKKKTNKVEWILSIIALAMAITCIFINPAVRMEWICIAIWIVNNMCKQNTIENLESTISDLHRYIKELEDSNADIWKKYGNTLKEKEDEESNSVH